MATINLTITYPDAKGADIVAALRDYYGKHPDGRDYTPAELQGFVQEETVRFMKAIYVDWKKKNTLLDDSELA